MPPYFVTIQSIAKAQTYEVGVTLAILLESWNVEWNFHYLR